MVSAKEQLFETSNNLLDINGALLQAMFGNRFSMCRYGFKRRQLIEMVDLRIWVGLCRIE